jgi:hypothetical protein
MKHRTLLALVAVVAVPEAAHAKDVQPQNNEIAVDVDATFAKARQNSSDVQASYTWFPDGLDRNDEVVPALRRFVRQPLMIGARVERYGDAYDAITGLYGDARAWLPGDVLYGKLELGLEYDSVENEVQRIENAFLAGVARGEVGVRIIPALELGGYYRVRPVLTTFPDQTLVGVSVERSGQTQELGGTFGLATPDDRLLLEGSLGYRMYDWTFEGQFPGDITGRAKVGALRASLQLTSTSSIVLRAEVDSTDWVNHRAGQDEITERGTEGNVLHVRGDIGYIFWFEGRWGFRMSLGGGYIGQGPLFQSFESGLFRLGVGFTTRY